MGPLQKKTQLLTRRIPFRKKQTLFQLKIKILKYRWNRTKEEKEDIIIPLGRTASHYGDGSDWDNSNDDSNRYSHQNEDNSDRFSDKYEDDSDLERDKSEKERERDDSEGHVDCEIDRKEYPIQYSVSRFLRQNKFARSRIANIDRFIQRLVDCESARKEYPIQYNVSRFLR